MTLLLASALKSCLLLVPALGASRIARTAAVRHAILATAVGCTIALPVLSLVVPHWSAAAILGDTGGIPAGWLGALQPWLSVVWAAGAGLCLAMIAVRGIHLLRLRNRCDEITEGTWADAALDISAEYRLSRPVTLLRSDTGSLLGTWGLDPKVVLPPQAEAWDESRVSAVLRHELAHVRRHDWLLQTLADVVRAVYWFNPLLWLACRWLRDESEHACDADVIGSGVDSRDYAAHLLAVARALRPQARWWPAVAMTHDSTLEHRVRTILQTPPHGTRVRRARGAIAVALAVTTLLLAVVGRPAGPRRIAVPSPRAQKLTLMLDGQIVDLSRGSPPAPDANAGLVAGHGQRLTVQTYR